MEEGRQEGREKGREEGRKETLAGVVHRLKANGAAMELIVAATGLTPEEIARFCEG